MKKFLLSMLGALIALPGFARDFTYEYEGQTLTYTVLDEEARTCKTKDSGSWDAGSAVSGDLVIPSVAKDGDVDYAVISIGYESFKDCFYLTSVTIPNSVDKIDHSAFISCSKLTSVTIPNSVSFIGNFAFAYCPKLTSVIIPYSVTKIFDKAFYECTGLKKSAYPSGLDKPFPKGYSIEYPREGAIFEDGFIYGPEKKTIYFAPLSFEGEYVIPNSVTKIDYGAFCYCSGLTSVTIPNSVTRIEMSAFKSCSGLTSVTIPDCVTHISDFVFSGCSGLTSVTIPNSVKYIKNYAFDGCSGLTSVTFGNSVTDINMDAFYGCTALTEVILPPSVMRIGSSAFAGNSKLASIIMGHNVRDIGPKAFDRCPVQTVSITAQTPPNAGDDTFSDYSGNLYLQGQQAADAYSRGQNCWRNFQVHVMIEPTEMKVEGDKTLNGKPGDTFQLTAKLYPENVTLPQVFWRSTNPDIAAVDANGLVTLRADMSDVKALTEGDDTTTRSCKIIAESLYADGPVAEFTVNDVTSGIEDVTVDGGNESGDIDFSAPAEIYNLQGVRVSDSVENLANGIYIVRQGNNFKKIVVK